MVQRVELQFFLADKPDNAIEALSLLPDFREATKARSIVQSRSLKTSSADWDVSINTTDTHCALVAVHRCWPLSRSIHTEADESVDRDGWRSRIASDSELKTLDHALVTDDLELDEPVEAVCVEWTNLRGEGVNAMFQAPSKLVLSAPSEARDALFRIADQVVSALPFVVEPFKVDRTSGDAVKAEKLKLSKKDTPADAFAKMGCSVAQHWFGNDAAARVELGVEQVHQLRVAQRRLKTALKLFPEWLDDDWQTNLAPELKWYGDLLGDARDWDVFTDTQLPAYAAADETQRDAWQKSQASADKKRLAARNALSDALRSPRYAGLALAYVGWFSKLGPVAKGRHKTLAEHARKRIRKHYRKIESAPDLTTLDTHLRHRLRIHAKRLRYALEFYQSLLTRSTRRAIAKRLGEFQSVLGEGNDAAVAAQRLGSLDTASGYQKGMAQGFAAAAQRNSAGEGERILRKIKTPRLKASL